MSYLYMPFGLNVLEHAVLLTHDHDVKRVAEYFNDADTVGLAHLECLKFLHKNPIFYTLSAIHSIQEDHFSDCC